MPEVSVIVPVYNAEQYLEKCIDSILKQSFTDFELILVDDGSTDNSFELCAKYAHKDRRVRAVRIANSGVSRARNTGIAHAGGKYIMFCDSDDYVEPNWISKLYALSEGNDCMAIGGYTIYDIRNPDGAESYVFPKYTYCHKRDFFDVCLQILFYTVWNKMYSTRLIKENDLKFAEDLSVGEDMLFNLDYLRVADDVMLLDKSCEYNYVLRKTESLNNKYYENLFDIYVRHYTALLEAMKEFDSDVERYKGTFYFVYLRMLIAALNNNMNKKNPAGFLKKLSTNSKLMKRDEFSVCLELADMKSYSKLFIWCLKTRSFPCIFVYQKLCLIKQAFKKMINK